MRPKLERCAYCLKRLPSIFISCTVCASVKLCIECFAAGAESGVHSKSHPYILKPLKLGTPTGLFNSWCFWNQDEELKLLDAIETYGFGNWFEIAAQLHTRTAEDCKRHYETYYVNGLIGKRLSSESVYRFRIQDHTYFENHSTDFTLDLLKLEDQKILGYMPYRDEFECEYLNNAEKTLIAIPYDTTDELLRELHLALVAIYNRHLAYRRFRHSVACEHGLVPRLLHKIKLTLPKVRNWHRKTTLRSSQRVVRRPSLLSYGGQTHAYTLFKEATSIDSPSTMKVSSFELQSPSSELSSDRKSTFDYVQSNFECIKSTNDAYPHFSTTFGDPRESPPDELNEQPCGCDSLGFNQASWLPSLLLNRSLSSKCGLLENANPCLCSKHRTHAVFCYTTINCLTTCQGDSSTTTSDSGIGSCETCTHSILSISGDHLTHTSHSINLLRRPIQFRRSRCNSDSICFLSSRHRSERRSSGPNSPVAMRHRIENINDATIPFEPIPRTSDIKPDLPTKLLAQAGICNALAAPPARRRGRPPKSSKRFPVRSAKGVSIPFKQRNLPLTDLDWMKPFLRFLTRREADELGAKLLRELQLRSELEQLYEYRKRGVRQMSDIHLRSMVPLVAEPLVATSGGAVRSRRPAFFKSGSRTRTMYSTFGRIKKIRTAARRRAVKGGHLRRRP